VPTIFSRIIDGQLPAHFVYEDDRCVAFLSINPLKPGHTLVVPRVEADHWLDLGADEWQHLAQVSQRLGAALQDAYDPAKVGMMLAGLEVPHVHVHLVPIWDVHDLDFANAQADPGQDVLAAEADRVRSAIAALR